MIRISTFEELALLAEKARAVVDSRGVRMPAAFMMSMQGQSIKNYLRSGLFLYEPKPKVAKPMEEVA